MILTGNTQKKDDDDMVDKDLFGNPSGNDVGLDNVYIGSFGDKDNE